MKKTLLTVILSMACLVAGATRQVYDKITINGESWEITVSPLLSLQGQAYDDFQKLLGKRNFISSANQRGYVAYWRVDRRNIYLEKVKVPLPNGENMEIDNGLLKKALKKYIRKGKIKARWLTGEVLVGKGSGPLDRNNPHAPSFEEEKMLTVKKGKIRK